VSRAAGASILRRTIPGRRGYGPTHTSYIIGRPSGERKNGGGNGGKGTDVPGKTIPGG